MIFTFVSKEFFTDCVKLYFYYKTYFYCMAFTLIGPDCENNKIKHDMNNFMKYSNCLISSYNQLLDLKCHVLSLQGSQVKSYIMWADLQYFSPWV